ncbi:MAG: hypothetical protein KKB62_00195 [Nanoarchaeota archaeon]|nr:hypothetical protein [Nanoarchaeota archaeon]
MLNWIVISFSFVVLVLYLACVILLFIARTKITGRIRTTSSFLVTGIFVLALVRVLDLLAVLGIFSVQYLHEFLVFVFSFFILMAIVSFYKTVKVAAEKVYKNPRKNK